MTTNSHFWGQNRDAIERAQLAVLAKFQTVDACQAALRRGKNVCLMCLTGLSAVLVQLQTHHRLILFLKAS
jgi:hypothetical protein